MNVKSSLFDYMSSIETRQNAALMECIRTGFSICFETADGQPADGSQPAPETDSGEVSDADDANQSAEQTDETAETGDADADGNAETGDGTADMQEQQPEPPPPSDPSMTAGDVNNPVPEKVDVQKFLSEFLPSGHIQAAIQNLSAEAQNGTHVTEELLKEKIAYEMGAFCNEKNYATIGKDNIEKITNQLAERIKAQLKQQQAK